jgi:DNA polymerase (family X)
MTKDDIAAVFEELAVLLELQGENAFRCNAYRNAARAVQALEGDLASLVQQDKLDGVRGIGEAMAAKIALLVTTGELPYLQQMRAKVPDGLRVMLKIPGLGPKKVKALHDGLQIESLDQLKTACQNNAVAALKGFGAKTQEKILEGLAFIDLVGKRVRADQALPIAELLLARVQAMPGVMQAAVCGSLRRRRETTKDIDLLAAADDAGPIMMAFVQQPEVLQIVGQGETKASVVVQMAIAGERVILNADLRVVPAGSFPFALHYFTGSKEHNIRMRQRAIERGLSLNEYALSGQDQNVPCQREEDIFTTLGLPYILPELREDSGEIELASAGLLPKLVERGQLRGVFHNHTTYSDGIASLEEMALETKRLGMEYFGVGDHSQSLRIANGMTPETVRQQRQEIDCLNKTLRGVRIIHGVESDILEDGSLDYDDETLAVFDYVVASVHTHFSMSVDEMTARICTALANPYTTMLGHMTGRLLLRRNGYRCDTDAILQAAARHGKMIEINANPLRRDIDWRTIKKAIALGIPLVINPDAHAPAELDYVSFGIDEARRGCAEARHIFNTQDGDSVMEELRRRKPKR